MVHVDEVRTGVVVHVDIVICVYTDNAFTLGVYVAAGVGAAADAKAIVVIDLPLSLRCNNCWR